jgi:uncharacterized repeat protein (TIGR01451 family)
VSGAPECAGPTGDLQDPNEKVIAYTVMEVDRDIVAPGDTVTYTVRYGHPGVNPLTAIEIADSLPPWTRFVPGTAVPPPDPLRDPDPGRRCA